MAHLTTLFSSSACLLLVGCLPITAAIAQSRGSIELDFRDKESDQSLNCRVKILAADGKPQRVRGMLYQQGWTLWEVANRYTGRVGDYTYQAFHGPQYAAASGGFTLDRKSSANEVVPLPRHADLALEGWRGGDLLSYVDSDETLRWLSAEDLLMAAVVSETATVGADAPEVLTNSEDRTASDIESSWWVEANSYYDVRPGSGLILHHWLPPAIVPANVPSSRLLDMAKAALLATDELPVHAEIGRLWERDVPIWLASGHIDSIQLLGSHLTYDGQRQTPVEPLVDPDPGRFRGPHAGGRLVEYIYWQVLECGLRIAPTAGSGFGRNGSPLGYNRVYAYSPNPSRAAWWQAVRDGQTFVTSGPLLRATVNGELPGKVFAAPAGSSIELDIALALTVADPVEYLEVVYNGGTLYRARLDEYARQAGKIPPQTVRESGWLLIRVVTERDHTYRIASTAPYYIEIGGRPRISARAVAFFQSWLEKSVAQINQQGEPLTQAAGPYLATARSFWSDRAEGATAE